MMRLSENGELVLVTEQLVCDGFNQRQRIILRVIDCFQIHYIFYAILGKPLHGATKKLCFDGPMVFVK